MSERLEDGTVLLYSEREQQCDLCGKIAELRPYGPKGECVCFECGMLDEKETFFGCLVSLFGLSEKEARECVERRFV